jgi:O-antigen/teichoic acid export membrane protein
MNLFAGGIFLGKQEILRSNIINAGPTLLTLILTVVFVWVLKLSVLGAFIAVFLANFIMFFYVYYTIIMEYRYKITWKYHEPLMKSMIKLGLVNALAIFVMQLNYRIDVLMLKKLSSLEQVGFYSVATQIAEQIWYIPYAIETIILSRSANATNDHAVTRTVASIFRVSMITGILASVLIFFIAPYVIPWIFGKEFMNSVPMIQTIPQVAIYTFLPALIINFVANLFLIPKYGGMGAVWSTNISYAIGSIAFILVYSKLIKMPVREILTLRKSDFYFYRDIRVRKKQNSPE